MRWQKRSEINLISCAISSCRRGQWRWRGCRRRRRRRRRRRPFLPERGRTTALRNPGGDGRGGRGARINGFEGVHYSIRSLHGAASCLIIRNNYAHMCGLASLFGNASDPTRSDATRRDASRAPSDPIRHISPRWFVYLRPPQISLPALDKIVDRTTARYPRVQINCRVEEARIIVVEIISRLAWHFQIMSRNNVDIGIVCHEIDYMTR